MENANFLHLPIFVALYMFSIGNATPKPYNRTFANAGISWVVVTSIFTQFVLFQKKKIRIILC